MATSSPLRAQIAQARALVDTLLLREERLLLARRPIDHDLEVEIMEAELEVIHLENLLVLGATARDDQPVYEPADLELPLAA